MTEETSMTCPVCTLNPVETFDYRADQAGAVGKSPSCWPCRLLNDKDHLALRSASGPNDAKEVLKRVYAEGRWRKHLTEVRKTYLRKCPKCGDAFLNTRDLRTVPCPFCGEQACGFAVPRGLGEPEFEEIEMLNDNGRVRAVFGWIGEGFSGDYQPDDPGDEPLLRFDLYVRATPETEEWDAPEDTSYCTQVSAFTDRETCRAILRHILLETEEALCDGYSVKGVCERLSWVTAGEFESKKPEGGSAA